MNNLIVEFFAIWILRGELKKLIWDQGSMSQTQLIQQLQWEIKTTWLYSLVISNSFIDIKILIWRYSYKISAIDLLPSENIYSFPK